LELPGLRSGPSGSILVQGGSRTDIFALGAVLYEMVTGHKAFEGTSPVRLMASILERNPAPAAEVRPISPALERVIHICLEKEPDKLASFCRETPCDTPKGC
jgi:serine/threonine protein kinase